MDYWRMVAQEFLVPEKGLLKMTLWKDQLEAKPFGEFSYVKATSPTNALVRNQRDCPSTLFP